MPRVRDEERTSWGIARHQPIKGLHHVLAKGLKGRSSVLRGVGQHDHVTLVGGESAVFDQVSLHVQGIVDAAGQLMLGAVVVDSDQ